MSNCIKILISDSEYGDMPNSGPRQVVMFDASSHERVKVYETWSKESGNQVRWSAIGDPELHERFFAIATSIAEAIRDIDWSCDYRQFICEVAEITSRLVQGTPFCTATKITDQEWYYP